MVVQGIEFCSPEREVDWERQQLTREQWKKNTMTTMMTDRRSRIGNMVVSATAAENGSDRHACLGMLRWTPTIDPHLLDEKLGVHPTTRVHFHLLHLIRIQLFLNPLSQRRSETTPRRRFTSPIVDSRRESIVHRQVVRKDEPFRCRRRGCTMRECRCRRGRRQSRRR